MRYLAPFLALLGLVLLPAIGLTAEAQPEAASQPFVLPMALVCVEAPGTSRARPCEPWCAENAATHVLRLMRTEQSDGSYSVEWRETHCIDYLAEEKPA